MYTIILILIPVAVLSGLVFLITKKKIRTDLFSTSVRIVFLLLTFSGIYLVISESAEIDQFLTIRNWPAAEAKIVSSRVEGKRAFHPEIIYEYQIGDKTYTGETDMGVPGFGTKANRLNVASTHVIRYPAGSMITIHYDPKNPSISFVKILPSYTVFLLLSVGSILFGGGFWGLLIILGGKSP